MAGLRALLKLAVQLVSICFGWWYNYLSLFVVRVRTYLFKGVNCVFVCLDYCASFCCVQLVMSLRYYI